MLCLGYKVYWVARNLNKSEVPTILLGPDLESKVNDLCPDIVIHLAATYDSNNLSKLLESNLELPLRLTSVMQSFPCEKRKLIYAGSYWQNGDSRNPGVPIDLYSATKSSIKKYIDYYCTYKDFRAIELVLYGTFGKSDNRGKLLDSLIESAISGGSLDLSPGKQKLNLVHIDDICDGFLNAIGRLDQDCERASESFALAAIKEFSIEDLVALVSERLNVKPMAILAQESIGQLRFLVLYIYKQIFRVGRRKLI